MARLLSAIDPTCAAEKEELSAVSLYNQPCPPPLGRRFQTEYSHFTSFRIVKTKWPIEHEYCSLPETVKNSAAAAKQSAAILYFCISKSSPPFLTYSSGLVNAARPHGPVKDSDIGMATINTEIRTHAPYISFTVADLLSHTFPSLNQGILKGIPDSHRKSRVHRRT